MAVWGDVSLSALEGAFRLDSEFWRPEYLRVERAINKLPHTPLGELSPSIRKGVFNILAASYVEEGIPFYRSSNVGVIVPKTTGVVYITEDRHAEEHKTALKRGDIMLAKTGKEAASVVLVPECNVSQDVVAIRPDRKKINPYFLAVFLNTEFGILQMRRWFQGQVQMHLSLPDTRQLLVPLVADSEQKAVERLVLRSEEKSHEARAATLTAESLLMESIGLDRIDLSPQLTYTCPFSDLEAAKRFGAEYFMPCKERVLSALAKGSHKPVESHAPSVREVWNPRLPGDTDHVRNYDVTDALEPFLDDTKEPQQPEEIGSSKKRFQAGDVVVSRLRSYLKEIAVVRTSKAVPSVGSSEFIVLRPTGGGLSAETLMVFLRCPLVQAILSWSQDGSNHPRFTEDDLLAIPVPDKLLGAQKQVDRQVGRAIDARREATKLLDDAKQFVERLLTSGRKGH